MTPANFKQIRESVVKYKIKPLNDRLIQAKQQVADLEMFQMRYQKFERWCEYLINGETTKGTFGGSATYTMFVTKYSVEPLNEKRHHCTLIDADMVIVPDLLVPHKLCVCTPTSKPGVRAVGFSEVDVPGIVTRMLEHSKNATNVVVGTFADVMREPCNNCGKESMVVGIDDYVDDDNGREFVVGQLCEYCLMITRIANFYKPLPNDPQFGVTDDIYRH